MVFEYPLHLARVRLKSSRLSVLIFACSVPFKVVFFQFTAYCACGRTEEFDALQKAFEVASSSLLINVRLPAKPADNNLSWPTTLPVSTAISAAGPFDPEKFGDPDEGRTRQDADALNLNEPDTPAVRVHGTKPIV